MSPAAHAVEIYVSGKIGSPLNAVYATLKMHFKEADFKEVYDNQSECMFENGQAQIVIRKQLGSRG